MANGCTLALGILWLGLLAVVLACLWAGSDGGDE